MGLPTATYEFDDLFSSTMAYKLPGEFDQTLKNHEVLGPLTQNRVTHNMGYEIRFTPTFGDNPSIGYIRTTTQGFKYQNTSVMTTARLDPAIMVGWQIVSEEEERKNRDDDVRLANLAELKSKQFVQSWKRKLVQAFYGNGVLDGMPALKGLKYWVPTNPGSLTVANLSETSLQWWQSKSRTGCGSWGQNGWFGSLNNYPLNAFVNVSDGSDKPGLVLSDHGVMQVAINAAGTSVRFVNGNNQKGGYPIAPATEMGNTDLMFMGKKWVWDRECDAGNMMFLHPEDFYFVTQETTDDEGLFEVLPLFRLPEQPLVKVSFAWTRHQLICTRRNRQYRLSGYTVPA
jgi:hypothetical protein